MDQPNIAKVLDAGLMRTRSLFVMQSVNGLPLILLSDELKIGLKERPELVVPVCQVVEHVHPNGIAHHEGDRGKREDLAISTFLDFIGGTFEYEAPEQAELWGEDVDARAEI